MTVMEARIVHISIDRNWQEVYDFAAQPDKMPLWASGLSTGLEPDGEAWITRGPLGSARVKFVAKNELGVIDHVVTMENGLEVNNALRVVPNGDGAEVMFTLLKRDDMSEEQFDGDADWILNDLKTLKTLLEA